MMKKCCLYNYETWYLPAIQAGAEMPDVIGGDYGGLAPGEVPDDQMEGQGETDMIPMPLRWTAPGRSPFMGTTACPRPAPPASFR